MTPAGASHTPHICVGMCVRIRAGAHRGEIGTLKERSGNAFVVRTDHGLVNIQHRMLLERMTLDGKPYRRMPEVRRDGIPKRDPRGRRDSGDSVRLLDRETDARRNVEGGGAADQGQQAANREAKAAQSRLDRGPAESGSGATAGATDPRGATAMERAIRARWELRECFICGRCGKCRHREVDVEVAQIEREARREE